MIYRFLFHELNHTILAVDISEIGIPDFKIETDGHKQSVLSVRFKSWTDLEAYFAKFGVKSQLTRVQEDLRRSSVAVLTVPSPKLPNVRV